MKLLQKLRTAMNQKSVVQNVLFCLAIILLMHLLYGVYRYSTDLQEGKKSKKKKCKGKRHSKGCAKSKCKGKDTKRFAVVYTKKKGKKKRWKCQGCPIGKVLQKVGKTRVCVDTSNNILNKNNPPPKNILNKNNPPPNNPCKDVDCNTLAVWKDGAVMKTARNGHGMVFLPDESEEGTVMIHPRAGGVGRRVEFYDVYNKTWTGKVVESMKTQRQGHGQVLKKSGFPLQVDTPALGHRMVFLPGEGQKGSASIALHKKGTVMVAGGDRGEGVSSASVDLYDVANGTWSKGNVMKTPRQGHGMVFLPAKGEKGTVMVAGGIGASGQYLSSVELYDVASLVKAIECGCV